MQAETVQHVRSLMRRIKDHAEEKQEDFHGALDDMCFNLGSFTREEKMKVIRTDLPWSAGNWDDANWYPYIPTTENEKMNFWLHAGDWRCITETFNSCMIDLKAEYYE